MTAEKSLRKMDRTELIEIIYALQQREKTLRDENDELKNQLSDRAVRLENAGSIAEAALSLNRLFEDAQSAAQQYLDSIRILESDAENKANKIIADADQQAEGIIKSAKQKAAEEADNLKKAAMEEAADLKKAAEEARVNEIKEQCERLLELTGIEIRQRKLSAIQEIKSILITAESDFSGDDRG